MKNNLVTYKRLKEENSELKRALALSLNKPLIKNLNDALQRINNGEYINEEEFFSSQKA